MFELSGWEVKVWAFKGESKLGHITFSNLLGAQGGLLVGGTRTLDASSDASARHILSKRVSCLGTS